MSSIVKTKLKAARDAIGKKDYQSARSAASQVLEYDPDNYNANVFLALAFLELGQTRESEQAYLKAISINGVQVLAWQGLSKFYERTEDWNKCTEVLEKLARLFAESNDAVKCAEALQKFIEIRRDQGSRLQVADALLLLLPDSPFYHVLSTLPQPDPTSPNVTATFAVQVAIHNSLPILEEIVTLIEQEEEETVVKEFEKRRTRLNAAGPEQLKKDVGREVWSSSRLPKLYNEILNHPNTPDDLRRSVESKLLRHRQRYLYSLPSSEDWISERAKVCEEVENLVNGIVLLGFPDELAWIMYIEGMDNDKIEGYDHTVFSRFMMLFPLTPLTRLLQGYFAYEGILTTEEAEEAHPKAAVISQEDSLNRMVDAFASLQDSTMAHQIMAYVYIVEHEYQSAIKVAESGLEVVTIVEIDRGKKLSRKEKAFNVILATSLVHLFPPKHHTRAIRILDDVLTLDPDNVSCLMGRGYVLQHACKWKEADTFFTKVAELLPDDPEDGLRAKEESAWCLVQMQELETGSAALRQVLDILQSMEHKEVDRARCWWRLGKCIWEMSEDKREEAYRCFITSLKCSPSYAPAFTSLGIYYAEFSSLPDHTRASKCYQKAFELDARESEAARRLAESFAEEREWDLVEVVARRTIEGEGGLAGGMGGDQLVIGRYLPTNAWAWKAIGVVELNRRNYSPAIQAFQIALRADDDDGLSWLRLGEAYSKAGRHVAALKALERAHELRPDDWICPFLTGEVQRQGTQYEEAIRSFESILRNRPLELGVLMSLAQTYLELGLSELSSGFTARAESSFLASIRKCLEVIPIGPGCRGVAWKTVGDAFFHLSELFSFVEEDLLRETFSSVSQLITEDFGGNLSGILTLPLAVSDSLNGSSVLELSAAAYDYRISLGSHEAAGGSAWFDLGISLYVLARKSPKPKIQERALQQALTSVREALRTEPDNATYWNALGSMNFLEQPKIAQNAYVRALEINSKDVVPWTNLGFLYLNCDDLELAKEALVRAQTLDPDHTLAWVGQGILATRLDREVEARALFEHAIGLSADVPEADLEYAQKTFVRLSTLAQGHSKSSDILLPVFLTLDRYCTWRPEDVFALHLLALVCEHVGHSKLGLQKTEQAIAILERAYEETEDPIIENQFIIVNTTLGRLRLSSGDYQGAIESFETVRNLLSEDEDQDMSRVLRVQSLFGAGLAHFKLDDIQLAAEFLDQALQASAEDMYLKGQVTVFLAQVLWSAGTQESQESAKTHLLECISEDPGNLAVITVLAGMGILTQDDDLVDATLSEIVSLPIDKRQALDPERDVTHLLVQHHLEQSDAAQAMSVAQRAIFYEPSRQDLRRDTASLALQLEDPDAALAILAGAQTQGNMDDLRQSLHLGATAMALDEEVDRAEVLKTTQKGVMLTPWDIQNWRTLALVRCRTA